MNAQGRTDVKLNSLRLSQVRLLTLAAAIALTACGCASITPARMVPKPSTTPVTKINASVRVMDVVGGKKSACFGCAPMIKSEQFKKALLLALRNSSLFDEVSGDNGDVALQATIQSEEQAGFLPTTAKLVVTYRFSDRIGKVIWTASYSSEGSSGNLGGAARTVHAHEGSARENLKALIQGIQTQWPNAQRDWEQAKSANNEAGYRNFLTAHGGSEQATEAQSRIDALRRAQAEAQVQAQAQAEKEWISASHAHSVGELERFVQHYPASARVNEARQQIESLLEERERTVMPQLRSAVANARELAALRYQVGDFASNITIEAPGSVLRYEGARIVVAGKVYARLPSHGDVLQPVDPKTFLILAMGVTPVDFEEVVAHTAGGSTSLGHVSDAVGALTIIVPRELLPCELEFRNSARGRILLKKR